MDWTIIAVLAIAGAYFLWSRRKNEERAESASKRLASDKALYDRIKAGMREYQFRDNDNKFWKAEHGQVLFETAHLTAFHVSHFAESRVGFYFKDLNQYGLHGFFVGNDPEVDVFHSYYRSDKTFQTEQTLLADDDD